jgi:DNA-binding transcriptional regulator/RsmH inhibitor MraZ
MDEFLGTFAASLDPEGQVSIPSLFRTELPRGGLGWSGVRK